MIPLGLSITVLKLFISIPYIFSPIMGTEIGTGMVSAILIRDAKNYVFVKLHQFA
jgi:hypothetical protein